MRTTVGDCLASGRGELSNLALEICPQPKSSQKPSHQNRIKTGNARWEYRLLAGNGLLANILLIFDIVFDSQPFPVNTGLQWVQTQGIQNIVRATCLCGLDVEFHNKLGSAVI